MTLPKVAGFNYQTVGLARWLVSQDPQAVLETDWLGSGLGVALYDRRIRMGGLLHVPLPECGDDRFRAEARPALFVDTAIPALWRELQKLGAAFEELQVCVAGGASFRDEHGSLNIGPSMLVAAWEIFSAGGWPDVIGAPGSAEDCRLRIEIGTGEVQLHYSGRSAARILCKSSTST